MKEAPQSPLCKYCNKSFKQKNSLQKFCSSTCNRKWWSDSRPKKQTERICIVCGGSFISQKGNYKTCSKKCSINNRERLKSNEYKKLHTDFENKRQRNIEYVLDRLKTDNNFRILFRLRARIKSALRKKKKTNQTLNLIGCSFDKLKEHLQITAIKNGYEEFNIEKYNGNKYHIDHIIPCNAFDLTKEEEQMKCFNYTNLQILLSNENLKKGCKIW
jgi:hypothetical protein